MVLNNITGRMPAWDHIKRHTPLSLSLSVLCFKHLLCIPSNTSERQNTATSAQLYRWITAVINSDVYIRWHSKYRDAVVKQCREETYLFVIKSGITSKQDKRQDVDAPGFDNFWLTKLSTQVTPLPFTLSYQLTLCWVEERNFDNTTGPRIHLLLISIACPCC